MTAWSEYEGEFAPKQINPDPKPRKRHRATAAEEKQIRKAFEFATCLTCAIRPVERHHITPRSQGGDDVLENLAPLCRSCHTKLEGHESGWERVAAAVRQFVITDNARRRYQEEHAGESFNRRYPCLTNEDPQFRADFRRIYGLPLASDDIEGYRRPL